MNKAESHEHPPERQLLGRLLLALTIGIIISGLLAYLYLSNQASRQTATALMTLADSGTRSIARWQSALFARARQIQNDPLLAKALADADREGGLEPLLRWMQAQRDAFGYRQILLLRADLSPLAVEPTDDAGHPHRPDLDTERAALARLAFADGEPRLTALHVETTNGNSNLSATPHLGLIVPLPASPKNGSSSPVAGLVLRIDPALSLTPLIEQTSSAGIIGRLLLVEDGQWNAVVINPAVLDQYSAADRDRLLTRFNDLFAPRRETPVQPIRISTEEPTYAVVRTTANPAWRLVALLPASQFEHAARQVGRFVSLITLLALGAAATGIGMVWWRQRWLQMQDRLRWSETLEVERAQLKQLFDAVDEIIYVADPDSYEILYANACFRKLLDPDPIGKKCYKVLQNRDAPCPFCTNDKIFGESVGQTHIWEFQNEVNKRWYRCADKAISWSDGRLVRFEIAADITDQRTMNRERMELEKLSAVGRLTAGVTHELNNPLMGVINEIQFCIAHTGAEDERHEVLRNAEHHTRRCIDIVHRLLDFSHGAKDSEALHPVNAVVLVEEISRLFAYRFREGQAELKIDASADLGPVLLRPSYFEQIVVNLLTNALDAVADTDRKQIHIGLARQGDEFVLRVRDSGVGMTDEQQALIFEPFFTTKPVGSGTGLGLSTTWAMVNEQDGRLLVDSEPGTGTCMTVALPQPAEAPTANSQTEELDTTTAS